MFQNKTNIEIIGFALGFWIRLRFLRYSLWNKDLLDTHLDLLDPDITSKNFVCLRDVMKKSSRHVLETSSRHVFKTSWRRLQHNNFSSFKTSWRRLQEVLREVLKMTSRCLQDVSKTSSRRLGRRKIVTLKTSSRRLDKMSWRHVLKTSWRHLLKMSSRRWRRAEDQQIFAGECLLLKITASTKNNRFK